jgi:hypothetical protein
LQAELAPVAEPVRSMTRLRCSLTVRSVIPNWLAISLHARRSQPATGDKAAVRAASVLQLFLKPGSMEGHQLQPDARSKADVNSCG